MAKMDGEVLADLDGHTGGHFGFELLVSHQPVAFLPFLYKCQHIGARRNRKDDEGLFQIHIFL